MIKFPFTPDGALAMCQHFFKLTDAELEAAAEKLGQDFPSWVQENFDLSERQVEYLNNIAPKVLRFMAANASFALGNRLLIVLAKEGAKKTQLQESKLTKPESKLAANISPDGTFTAEGEFVITITY